MIRISAILLCALVTSCALIPSKQERALQRVAKDWSQMIRASQIIPVYPMTEDMLPGDIFLVQTSLEEQVSLYRKRGFLPIDPTFARLPVMGYNTHYRDFRRDKACPSNQVVLPGRTLYNPPCLEALPQAAFPSYSFEVSSSQGFGIGVPVQAVNLGLNLTRSKEAVGSVSIRDAYTFGVDVESLLKDLSLWAQRDADRLKPYRGIWDDDQQETYKPSAYLRVVSRIYLAGSINVYMQSASKLDAGAEAQLTGGGLVAGVGGLVDDSVNSALDQVQSLDVLNCHLAGGSPIKRVRNITDGVLGTTGAAVERITDVTCRLPPTVVDELRGNLNISGNTKALTDVLSKAVDHGVPTSFLSSLPSAKLQVSSVSKNSVGMSERFERLMVVGYIGFDVPIDPDGQLGPPIPSFAILERSASPGVVTRIQRETQVSDWNTLLGRLGEQAPGKAYAAATETVRCVGQRLTDTNVSVAWNALGFGSQTDAVDIQNELRGQLGALEEAGRIELTEIARFLDAALKGQAACAL